MPFAEIVVATVDTLNNARVRLETLKKRHALNGCSD